MSVLKHLKNTPTCFDHHSDHLRGARKFHVKVTEFKSFCKLFKIVEVICGNVAAHVWCACMMFCVERCADYSRITTSNLHNFKNL